MSQKPFSREAFEALSPRAQGYVSYMQAAWNPEVPDDCPYPEGSKEYEEWFSGAQRAVLEVQDYDDG